jgi:hypothetical protein
MARRTRVVTITEPGRDIGKSFLLTELDAFSGEWWAIRALTVLGNAGVNLPGNALESGMAGIAAVEASTGAVSALMVAGLRMLPGVDPNALKPLLDEMMNCVQYRPAMGGTQLPPQPLMYGEFAQIEEIMTIMKLRAELIELHTGFSLAGANSILGTIPQPPPAS